METESKFFWVIEGDACYWDGHGCEQHNFTADIGAAVKFASQDSGECIKYHLLEKFKVGLRVTQHGWMTK